MKTKIISVVILSLLISIALVVPIALADDEEIDVSEWEEIVSWHVDENGEIIENGLKLLDREEVYFNGKWEVVERGGSFAVRSVPSEGGWMFLYFDIDDDVLFEVEQGNSVLVSVEFYNEGLGSMAVNYVSWANSLQWCGTEVSMAMANEWQTHRVVLTNVKFDNSMMGVADIRLNGKARQLSIRKVTISTPK